MLSKTDTVAIPDIACELLVKEMLHRQANEYAATLATLRILKARGVGESDFLDQALERVENQVELQLVLLDSPGNQPLHDALARLCQCILQSRMDACEIGIELTVDALPVAEHLRRPILLVAYELVNNAVKHARTSDNPIEIIMGEADGATTVIVSNDGEPFDQPAPGSSGLHIVGAIADGLGGGLLCSHSDGRASFAATFGPSECKSFLRITIEEEEDVDDH